MIHIGTTASASGDIAEDHERREYKNDVKYSKKSTQRHPRSNLLFNCVYVSVDICAAVDEASRSFMPYHSAGHA